MPMAAYAYGPIVAIQWYSGRITGWPHRSVFVYSESAFGGSVLSNGSNITLAIILTAVWSHEGCSDFTGRLVVANGLWPGAALAAPFMPPLPFRFVLMHYF